MAVIHFTTADVLQTTIVPAEIYPSEISKISGPSASSSGKSQNFVVDITITDGKFKGKTRTVMFSSGTSDPSLLGSMQFFPQSQFLIIDTAINGVEKKAEDQALDLDTLLNKPFEASWGIATVEGHMINVINGFHPKGYKTTAPAF